MGVDQQERMAPDRIFRRNGNTVRAALISLERATISHLGLARMAIEGLQAGQGNVLNIAANTALRKAQGHPGLKMANGGRMNIRVGG